MEGKDFFSFYWISCVVERALDQTFWHKMLFSVLGKKQIEFELITDGTIHRLSVPASVLQITLNSLPVTSTGWH